MRRSVTAHAFGNALGNGIVTKLQQVALDEKVGNLSGGAKQAYDSVIERGYTPQQALAYAQDFQGIEAPISLMQAGAPSVADLSSESFGSLDLSDVIAGATLISFDVAPSTAAANRDVARINALQATDGVPFYLDPRSANQSSATGASGSWGRGASGSWGGGGFLQGASDRFAGDVTDFIKSPLSSAADAINGTLLFAYDAIQGPIAYLSGGMIGDTDSIQRNSQRGNAIVGLANDFADAVSAGDSYQIGQMSVPLIAAVATDGISRIGDLAVIGRAETLVGGGRQISNLRTISSSEANSPFLTEKAAAQGWYPPYAEGPGVRTFTTSDDLSFVRVHVDADNPQGGFLVRQNEIAHLNNDPEAIQIYLGLKDTPAYISDARVPVGTRMQAGIIGPQPNFGLNVNSGFQYQLLEQIPRSSFSNTRPLIGQ